MIRSALQLIPRGLFGPVFEREVRVVSRRASSFWVRSLYTLALAALASLIYFVVTADVRFGSAGRAAAIQQLQMFAPTLGAFFAWFQFVIMCFVASVLTSGAIADERRKGSLGSLLATPLSPGQIILGKFAGRLVQIVTLIALGVPLLLAARLFGGISPGFVFSATVLTASTAMVHASISLAASTRTRSSTTAASSGLITGVLWCFLPMILTALLAINSGQPRTLRLMPLSPYFSLGWETANSLAAVNIPIFGPGDWLYAVAYNAVGCALFLMLATGRLRRLAATGETSLPAPEKKRAARSRAAGAPIAAVPAPDPLSVWNDPLLWRELRQRVFMRSWHPWAATVAIALLLLYVYHETGIHEMGVFIVTSAALLALFYFQSALVGANSIAGEREGRSLDALLTTPLTAKQIVRAKWLGALRRLWPIAALYAAIAICCAVLPGTFHWVLLPHLALVVVPPVLFLVATGVGFSVITKRSTVAASLNLGLGLMLWVGAPLLIMALGSIVIAVTRSSPSDEVIGLLAVWNPAPMVVTAIQGASSDALARRSASAYHTFFNFDVLSFTLTATGFAAAYCALAWIALRWAARALAKRTNRSA